VEQGLSKSLKLVIFQTKKMGITIHYKGKLNSPDLINPFCEELMDISKEMGWHYDFFDFEKKQDKLPLKGLFIGVHKKAESLVFMIDQSGFLRNPIMIEPFSDGNDTTYFNHTKTQFAPVEVHIAIIKLLKYIQKKYMSNLEVWDEGTYWEKEDPIVLKEKIDFLTEKINFLADALNSVEFEKGASAESVADKIEDLLRKMDFGKSEDS
jgi:hypothetical protein